MQAQNQISSHRNSPLCNPEIIIFRDSQIADYQYSFSCKNLTINTNKEKDSLRLNPQSGELCGARLTSPPDLLTSFYYFGARYYDCDLSGLFLSVDPMSDKYPSISPYAYCAWNPVKLVDPDGREMGDYYNENGKYLGWDGKKDYNVHIVTDDESIKTITNNKKHNRYTSENDVSIAVSTNYFVLQQCVNVLNICIDDNGENEFGTSMGWYLSSPIVKGDSYGVTIPPPPTNLEPTTSIHSHTFADEKTGHWIEYMSTGKDKDSYSFQKYDLNIIVGERSTGTGYGAAFYERQPYYDNTQHKPLVVIGKDALERMANGINNAVKNITPQNEY